MPSIRQRRTQRLLRRYRQAAVVYLLLGALVLLLEVPLDTLTASETWSAPAHRTLQVTVLLGLLGALAIWAGARRVTLVLVAAGAYLTLTLLLTGLGINLRAAAEVEQPNRWTDSDDVWTFIKAELGTDSPFFTTAPREVEGRTVVLPDAALETLGAATAPERAAALQERLPSLDLTPRRRAFVSALLVLAATLMLFRAARHTMVTVEAP